MNIRNYLTIFFLSLAYFFSTYLEQYSETFVFFGLPIVLAILAYKLTLGRRLVKVAVAGLTPIVSLVWILIFPEVDRYLVYAFMHCFLITMLIAPMIEIVEDASRMIKNHSDKVFLHLKSRNTISTNVRNVALICFLSLVYFYALFLDQYSIAFVYFGLPILFAILAYNLAAGVPLIKRTVTALIPVVSFVWAILLPEVEGYIPYAILHLVLISMVITPMIETFGSADGTIRKHLTKVMRTFENRH